jgi:hypothetical protein
MFKASASLFEPDGRFRDMVVHDTATGKQRGMRIDDLRNLVAGIELSERVPPAIRQQFDVARNAFVYSWFVYEFATLAEQQCFATLEMALRHRLDPAAAANTTRSPGLQRLIKSAVENGWLRREDFLLPPAGGSEALCLLDFIAPSRNHVMHGNIQLLPQGTPDMMRLCADVVGPIVCGRAGWTMKLTVRRIWHCVTPFAAAAVTLRMGVQSSGYRKG